MLKIIGLIFLLIMTDAGYGYDRITGKPFASRSEVIGQNGMVATSHPLATQIGLDILKNYIMIGGKVNCKKFKRNKPPKCNDQSGCNWVKNWDVKMSIHLIRLKGRLNHPQQTLTKFQIQS